MLQFALAKGGKHKVGEGYIVNICKPFVVFAIASEYLHFKCLNARPNRSGVVLLGQELFLCIVIVANYHKS